MSVLTEVLAANAELRRSLWRPVRVSPAARAGIRDPHLYGRPVGPAKYAGLAEGDAHVIRNAGGRASDDAIRSLVISHKLLGTSEWFVIHHTNCGMEFFTDEVMRGLLASSLETAALGDEGFYDVGDGPGSSEGDTSTG